MAEIWRVRSLKTDYTWEGPLEAVWEAQLDPISDDFTPDEIGATELLQRWAERVREYCPDGLVPIYWSVRSQGKFERMPFQFHLKEYEDFLTEFSWLGTSTEATREDSSRRPRAGSRASFSPSSISIPC